jgi:hypothetical protein
MDWDTAAQHGWIRSRNREDAWKADAFIVVETQC